MALTVEEGQLNMNCSSFLKHKIIKRTSKKKKQTNKQTKAKKKKKNKKPQNKTTTKTTTKMLKRSILVILAHLFSQ